MPGLVGLEQPFHLGHGLGRAHADRLVENHPAGDRPALFLAATGHYSSSSRPRSRATSGDFSRARRSSQNCRSWCRAGSGTPACISSAAAHGDTRPRMNFAWWFSALITRLIVRRAERRDEGGRDLQIGRHAHLGDRDHRRLDQRITDFAALQHLGQARGAPVRRRAACAGMGLGRMFWTWFLS